MTFTPADGTSPTTLTAGGSVQRTSDTDYLAGGVWLFLPDDVMSADDLEIGAFGDGSDPFHQNELMALQGTARYNGLATGIYTDKSEGEVSYWDSSVSLTADFGRSNALGTISGSLSNFEANGESLTGHVSLGTANIGSSDSGFFEGDLSGTVEGIGLNGLYGGQFFGNSEADSKPGSVGGTLGATSSDENNSFVGVFGAYKQTGGGSAGTGFANLNPTQAGYAATTASQVANARPQAGSVTQSSNVSNSGITEDRVTVTAQHGASRNNYEVSKATGEAWSISTSDGNPVAIDAKMPFDGQELYNRVNGGTLYVDVYSDIEAPSRVTTGGMYPFTFSTINVGGQYTNQGGSISLPASLNGVSGIASCTGCSFVYTTGSLNITGGSMTFTPADGTSPTTLTAGGSVQRTSDTDYLAGGVWLFLPDDVMSADDLEIGAFGDGSDPFHQNELMALQGTARYNGLATGIYTDKSEGEVSYWDSSVSLTADFGRSNALGTISGSLSNFEANGESLTGHVSLGTANIGSSDSGFFEGDLSGTVEGIGLNGLYGGQFFGNSEADSKPGSVGGTLGATSSDENNSFVGVFGAYKQ